MAEVKKNNLLNTPEMHIQDQKHQINTELIEIIKFRQNKKWLISIYKDGKLEQSSAFLFFTEMKNIKSEYESDSFISEDKDYNEALKENRRVDYVNTHSICKIWYESYN